MTDKQIIIDGVDVHWCEHYTGNIGYLTDKNWTCRAKIQGTKCEDWSNCYFKRWQRKEQECEELKEERDTWHYQWEKRYEICESLSDDIDKLCEQLEAYKMEAEEGKEVNAELKAENDELKEELEELKEENEYNEANAIEFKQTLTEIKEIAENAYCLTNATNKDMAQFAKQILQKISEVEDVL